MRKITEIIIHCSATTEGRACGAKLAKLLIKNITSKKKNHEKNNRNHHSL